MQRFSFQRAARSYHSFSKREAEGEGVKWEESVEPPGTVDRIEEQSNLSTFTRCQKSYTQGILTKHLNFDEFSECLEKLEFIRWVFRVLLPI